MNLPHVRSLMCVLYGQPCIHTVGPRVPERCCHNAGAATFSLQPAPRIRGDLICHQDRDAKRLCKTPDAMPDTRLKSVERQMLKDGYRRTAQWETRRVV